MIGSIISSLSSGKKCLSNRFSSHAFGRGIYRLKMLLNLVLKLWTRIDSIPIMCAHLTASLVCEDPWKNPSGEAPSNDPRGKDPWKDPHSEDPWKDPRREDPWKDPRSEDPWKDPCGEDPWKDPCGEDPWKDPRGYHQLVYY